MRDFYDVVVIGSGFGGSVAGLRCAAAGHSVAILERGAWWSPERFPRRARELYKLSRTRLYPHGLYDIRNFDDVTVYSGNGVGGGSLIGSNILATPPPGALAALPADISPSALNAAYARVRAMLEPGTAPGVETNPKARQLRALSQSIPTARWRPVDLSVNFDAAKTLPMLAGYPHAGRVREPCVGCRSCNLGCHVLAKNTLDLTYLPAAMRAGAHVVPRCEVVRIASCDDGSYQVWFRLGRPARRPGRPAALRATRGSVRATRVVLAAGVIGSTELLLRARERGDLGKLSERLGSGFSVNGVHVAMGFDAAEAIPAPRTPVVVSSAVCPDLGDSSAGLFDILIEDANQTPLLTGFGGRGLPWLRDLGEGLGRALRRDGVRGLLGYIRSLDGRIAPPTIDERTVTLMIMGRDRANGSARIDERGKLAVSWQWRDNHALLTRINRLLADLGPCAPVRVRFNPIDPDARVYTGHPMGGCPMGETPATGAVASDGQVFGHPGLYVTDGSTLPGALGVNPAFTIAALAEITSARLLADARA